MNIADLRVEYKRSELDEGHANADPIAQFSVWWDDASAAQVREANAMTLATADADGKPAARTVLLKGFDQSGFVFFTNYDSRKGAELAANARAALLFFWPELERQIRIDGSVERTSAQESDEYFRSRPLASRIGAWASPQSRPISSKAWLMARVAEMTLRHATASSRPPHWGGYRVVPTAIEFWQGRPSRLHDRLLYTRADASADAEWARTRLAP
ncbi:MAG TPA: pyridoxamine 5'-phosphate oxidase [Burkholderiaceae bacterium]|jgi:pyridoxamine 5'-phosphate oxidase|nr:pyridoxamine 5'-phosphate oxidase [Burkholderiaceae bacterium]